MVCPNCHSDQIIQVQDQHFCINCGQQVPDTAKPTKVAATVAVQSNGLPAGVKILGEEATALATAAPDTAKPNPAPAKPISATAQAPVAEPPASSETPLIKSRTRIKPVEAGTDDNYDAAGQPTEETQTAPAAGTAKPKKRKPGRPKAGPLDAPRSVNLNAPITALPTAPKLAPADPAPEPAVTTPPAPASPAAPPVIAPAAPGPRRMSDLSPRHTSPVKHASSHPANTKTGRVKAKKETATETPTPATEPRTKRPVVHKVGVPPLHYAPIIRFSLRARMQPHFLAFGTLASLVFAGTAAYGAWVFATGGLTNLSRIITATWPKAVAEGLLLAALYYIGRSLGQAAITYGLNREADQRPVSLAKQIAVGINSFSRRLVLDLSFAVIELLIAAAIVALVLAGGTAWPIYEQAQVVLLFLTFLVLLYLWSAASITRGLAGVMLTLTTQRARTAARHAWRLFSHRFELLGFRFFALGLELLLATPLALVAPVIIAQTPHPLAPAATAGIGLLALVAGSLFGVGTAAWWAGLYRRLVLVDQPAGAIALLSGRQPTDARPAPLVLIVALASCLITAILALPWLHF